MRRWSQYEKEFSKTKWYQKSNVKNRTLPVSSGADLGEGRGPVWTVLNPSPINLLPCKGSQGCHKVVTRL